MRIKDIRYVNTNETRTDGRYPLRIGSNVVFYYPPEVGSPAFLQYITDNQGNPKEGILRTSAVANIVETDKEIYLETRNSVYEFEK